MCESITTLVSFPSLEIRSLSPRAPDIQSRCAQIALVIRRACSSQHLETKRGLVIQALLIGLKERFATYGASLGNAPPLRKIFNCVLNSITRK